ncbi:MAG: winged helix-turn-helix domain-containing protein [Abditibacteriales bacterium]|nr:winged helix-turn-helix domain-containing protein [Abditibacteriales bacterium]MDW8364830.1 winged helix-turn-helix domain-containing protein [Abditibacteriales bacterium]
MAQRDVTDAFEMLLTELERFLQETREEAAEASRQGKYEWAQTLLTQAQQMEKFIADIRAKQQEWQRLIGKPRRQRKGKRAAKRSSRGECTSKEAYRLPILRALSALGGEASVQAVLQRVYDEMKSRLKPADEQPLPSNPKEPRWRNTAMWERHTMVNEGLLRNDSPRGIWAITEHGRAYLRQHGG